LAAEPCLPKLQLKELTEARALANPPATTDATASLFALAAAAAATPRGCVAWYR